MLCTPARATVGTPGSFDRKGIKLLKASSPCGWQRSWWCWAGACGTGQCYSFCQRQVTKDQACSYRSFVVWQGKESAHEHPLPRCLFAVGSPLGMRSTQIGIRPGLGLVGAEELDSTLARFLSIRLSQKAQRASRRNRVLRCGHKGVEVGRSSSRGISEAWM